MAATPTSAALSTPSARCWPRRAISSAPAATTRRLLALLEAGLPSDDPEVGLAVRNLGLAYKKEGLYRPALACFYRALAQLEAAEGPDHPHVASTLAEIAEVADVLAAEKRDDAEQARAAQVRAPPVPATAR